ncbi:tyrosine-type recombinase/integrase [Actinokineospora xionganensis]|uniref:Tyrosine-type recombinase/integrase n=1 Tax=Actinokineospora xionganensis TaxID=2684470 RepID=A0ABR7LG46_9PSEU|nr:tyrosine-type recombinase/integrase [Actinokineospora xionganensis]MBC6451690.1 tyrosine-type recombinase/integrase [Actinokineospora xionganensis]
MAWVEKSGKKTYRVRYFTDDGTIGSIPGFPTKKLAEDHADSMEADQRSGTWIDPAGGQTTFGEWVEEWLDALDVGLRTEENYRSKLRAHILPRWAETPLADITSLKAHAWAKTLRRDGLADVTVSDTLKLLTLIMSDAAEDKLIPANPIRARRRGRGRRSPAREIIWATPEHVIRIADQANACYGIDAAILILTAAFTGARWGELTGLQRRNLHLDPTDNARIVIDPNAGSLHESASGKLWLGPPKTPESARTITLPPFLVPLLRNYLDTHDHPHVFVTTDAELHRRSNFARRAMRPAADGNLNVEHPRVRTRPIQTGLTFHGLRHSHKTWMITDDIPEIAQSRRLGHKLPDKIQEAYSHVSDEVKARLLHRLQARWTTALTELPATNLDTGWRAAA